MPNTHSSNAVHLILGGARSGKSGYAEQLAAESGLDVCYVATAKPLDAEMAERITKHQNDRPSHWHTIEEPVKLDQVLAQYSQPKQVVLIDCLTLWLMNVHDADIPLEDAVERLLLALKNAKGPVLLVSNEISMGVVPMGELSRNYVDNLGRLHQQIAKIANQVTLMVAGIPMAVKA